MRFPVINTGSAQVAKQNMAHYKGAASEGGRAQILMKKRQKEQEEIETRKRKIEDELKIGSIQNKFASHYDAVEQQLKSNTIGETFCFPFIDKIL